MPRPSCNSLSQSAGVLFQVGALAGSDKPFHGLSSKPAAQLPKQEKALAQAVINCAAVSTVQVLAVSWLKYAYEPGIAASCMCLLLLFAQAACQVLLVTSQ